MQPVDLMALTAQHAHTVMEQLPLEESLVVLGVADVLFRHCPNRIRFSTWASIYM